MIQRRSLLTRVTTAALPLALGLAVTTGSLGAQESTPMAGMGETPHPAHIHSGTCETLGDIVFPLNDLTAPGMAGTPTAGMGMDASPMAGMDMDATPAAGMDMDATPAAGMDMDASPMAGMTGMGEVVAESTTTIEASLDDILAAEHAINVHESAENIQNYIACGDLTGTPEGGQLEIQLNELNDSGYQGQATLVEENGATTVNVVLMRSDDGMMATPAA